MSKRRNKRPVEQQKPTEEVIKSVMDLYKPNKFQLFIMKKVGLNNILTGNKKRVEEIIGVLNINKDEVIELVKRYYLS